MGLTRDERESIRREARAAVEDVFCRLYTDVVGRFLERGLLVNKAVGLLADTMLDRMQDLWAGFTLEGAQAVEQLLETM